MPHSTLSSLYNALKHMQRIRGWSYLEEWFFLPNELADKEHACMRESWERFHWSLTNLQLLLCDFCEINARSHWLFSCNDRALLARCPMYIERFHSRGQHLCKFIGTKESVCIRKSSTPKGLVWNTNMAAVSLFWDTNMAAVTSCENTLNLCLT